MTIPAVILGPCPCQGCGAFVWAGWEGLRETTFPRWRDANGEVHRCAGRYNDGDGLLPSFAGSEGQAPTPSGPARVTV